VKRNTSRLKPGEKANLDLWLELMDWSRLQTLHLFYPSSETLRKLSGSTLPSLQHAVYSGKYIVDFLAIPTSPLKSISLEQVSLCPPGEVINATTKHQGAALQSLKMNYCSPSDGAGMLECRSKPYLYPSDAVLNSTHFSDLLFACPNIETLDIDLEMKEEWDYNLLDTIVSFPRLTKLVLPFKGEKADTNEGLDEYLPYENEEGFYHRGTSLAMMQGLGPYLRKKKVGRELEILETWVGDTKVEN
jgi:hypothetical protein